MSNLPKALREKLSREYALGAIELVRKQGARDTTQKFLWRLADHSLIESVLIPANPSLYGEPSDRHTLCVSTQVGCAYGCKFCASGLDGWKRNLLPHEIVEQVMGVERWCAQQSRTENQQVEVAPDASRSSLLAPPSLLGTFTPALAATSYRRPNTNRLNGPEFTSRVCNTAACAPNSRRTISSASRMLFARKVLMSIALSS